jgi:hypothetical protein
LLGEVAQAKPLTDYSDAELLAEIRRRRMLTDLLIGTQQTQPESDSARNPVKIGVL